VSTLLRGFLSFREAVTRLLARLEVPAEQALVIVRKVDEVSAEASFRTADIYVAKLNRVLDATREELIRKDKLAALGGLVAGVAHEINTPLGVAVTAASLVADRLHEVETAFTAGTLRRQDLQHGLAQAQEAARMTLGNLRRAAGMVGNFKQIAVDQQSEALPRGQPRTVRARGDRQPRAAVPPHAAPRERERAARRRRHDLRRRGLAGDHQPGPERADARLPRPPRGPDHADRGSPRRRRVTADMPGRRSRHGGHGAATDLRALLHHPARPRRQRARHAHRPQPRHRPARRERSPSSRAPAQGTLVSIQLPAQAPERP
jgi:hypothetical protein